MTPYAKTIVTAFAMSAAAHVGGAGILFTCFPNWSARSAAPAPPPTAKLVMIQSQPARFEPPQIIPPSPLETPPLSELPPPEPVTELPPPPTPLPPLAATLPTPSLPTLSTESASVIATPLSTVDTSVANAAPSSPNGPATCGPAIALKPAQPNYFYNPKPHYPRTAKTRGWEGTTLLRVLVMPEGYPGQIEIAQSSGYSILDEASLEAVRGWKFIPARLGDQAVAGTVEVPITFKLVTN